MEFTAEMISSFLEGEIIGDANVSVNIVSKIEEAQKGSLTFLSNPKYEQYIYTTNASIVIVNRDFEPKQEISATIVKVENAYSCFAKLLELYAAHKRGLREGVSSLASIAKDVTIPEDLYIGEFAVVESGVTIGEECMIYPQVYIGKDVKIGNNVTIYAGVKIYDECVIGNNVTLHSGAVIGADGFGFAPQPDGSYSKIPQIGNVEIKDNVEIGANSCIDCATMGSTIIEKGVKLDNLIQIGHNVTIGANTVAAAQVGIAGSTTIGEGSIFGGQVGISGHISVAPKTTISSQSGINSSVRKEGTTLMGTPAFDAALCRRSIVGYKSLPDILKSLRELEKEVKTLKEQLNK